MRDCMGRYIARKISFAKKLLVYLFFSRIIINSTKVIIPRGYPVSLGDFLKEVWISEVIKKIYSIKKGAFVDVGYNLGQTLIKVKSLDSNIEYYGFEPNPNCYYYTNKLIKANKFRNCFITPVGLSNKSGIANLFARSHSDAASLVPNFKDPVFYSIDQFVPIFEGDTLISYFGITSISVIKIDVEGGELEVIQGLKNSISKFRPYILCEVLPINDENTERGRFRKERQDMLEKVLRNEKYVICRILRNGEIIALDTIETQSNPSLRDYIFIPLERIEEAKNVLGMNK